MKIWFWCLLTLSAVTLSVNSQADSGEIFYQSTCNHCHGSSIAPVLKGKQLSARYIEYVVRAGVGAMPAFRETEISPSLLKDIVSYINNSKADKGRSNGTH